MRCLNIMYLCVYIHTCIYKSSIRSLCSTLKAYPMLCVNKISTEVEHRIIECTKYCKAKESEMRPLVVTESLGTFRVLLWMDKHSQTIRLKVSLMLR